MTRNPDASTDDVAGTVTEQPTEQKILGLANEQSHKALRGHAIYWWIYTVLLWVTPILSTILAALLASAAWVRPGTATTPAPASQPIAIVILSIIVSILTTINSVIKPEERFIHVTVSKNRFQRFIRNFPEEMKILEEEAKKSQEPIIVRAKWLLKKSDELTHLIECWERGTEPPELGNA